MRIALVSTCAVTTPPTAYGGTELIVAELARGLHGLGHEVTTFATGDSSAVGTVRYHFERAVWPPSDLAEMRHAGHALREVTPARYDILHVNHAATLPFTPWLTVPTVLTLHHERVESLIDHYHAYPDVSLVAISQRQVELSPELPIARVIHHGLDVDAYPEGPGDGGYVAFLGRFAPEKAPHLALDAAREAGMEIRLGGAPHEVARDYFSQQVEPRLHAMGASARWLGELSPEPKLALLRHARALLMPIVWEEPFGLVMIEAMLVGTPVIAFDCGSASELVEHGVTGWVVRDVHEMAQCMGRLTTFDRQRCRARAQERWSTSRMTRDYVALYERLIRGRALSEAGAQVISLPRSMPGSARHVAPARARAVGHAQPALSTPNEEP